MPPKNWGFLGFFLVGTGVILEVSGNTATNGQASEQQSLGKLDEALDKLDEQMHKLGEKVDKLGEPLGKLDEKLGKLGDKFGKLGKQLFKPKNNLVNFASICAN